MRVIACQHGGGGVDNLWESVLHFQHVSLGDQTQVVKPGGKAIKC